MLRGVASLAVLFWHWPHFFYRGTRPERVAAEKLPLHDFLYPLYQQGGLGVDVFFCLSGFIFYWLYADAVAGKAVSGRNFLVLRFSRLYPLHLVTLLAVAAGQDLYLRMTGGYFVYSHNDAYHFLLNVLFAPAWDFEAGFSFNAPVWSVSVEVALYAFFFALCRLLPVRAPLLLGVAAAGLFVVEPHYLPLGRGIAAFFIGGTVYLVYRRIVASGHVAALARWLPWLLGVLWLFGLVALSLPAGVGPAWPNRMAHLYTTLVLFPLTILTLAVVETRRGPLMRGAAFLGDVSYSSYLLHFPLQLAAAGAAIALGLDRSVFSSAWTLTAFIAILLAVSFASHRFLELPAQRALRRRG